MTDRGAAAEPTDSVGLATRNGTPISFDKLQPQTESAMHGAKRDGKNRVGADPAPHPPGARDPALAEPA
jgi:PleD family two-component response regulator